MDGVPSITQCPIALGDSYIYKWCAVEYGTGWYHSHFYIQAWDGVFGGILINGPATANYDVDLSHIFLNDWYHVCLTLLRNRALLLTSLVYRRSTRCPSCNGATADCDKRTHQRNQHLQ